MTNELQTALEWLAGEANEQYAQVQPWASTDPAGQKPAGKLTTYPGSGDTLHDHDMSLVLAWLGDAGYVSYMSKSKPPPERVCSIWRDDMDERIREYGDTLPEALAEAMKALHRVVEK